MPTLEILTGAQSGRTFSFSEEAKIGKDNACHVTLADAGVSRHHARIFKEDGGLKIEDLGSSNGTYVNFKKRGKGESTPLSDNDVVFFGRTVAKFWQEAPPETGGPVSPELLRETFPVKGLHCTKCNHDLEPELREKIREQERVEVVRRLRLHELDASALDRLLSQAK